MSLTTIRTLQNFCEDAFTRIKFGQHAGKTFCYVATFDKQYCNWIVGITSSSPNIIKFQNYYRFNQEIVLGLYQQKHRRTKPKNAWKRWSKKDDADLIKLRSTPISQLATIFSRTPRAIIYRMKKLNL